MSEIKIDYWQQGYNGFWDGLWTTTFIAHKHLQIEDDPEAKKAFNAGWNTAVIEQKTIEHYEY